MDEGLLGSEDAGGDSLGDLDRGGGVAVEGEEGLADGDLDLLVDEGDDVLVAADDADAGGGVGGGAGGELAGAVEEEALRDVVGAVIDEGLLDQLVEIVEGDAQGGLAEGGAGQVGGNLADDAGLRRCGSRR